MKIIVAIVALLLLLETNADYQKQQDNVSVLDKNLEHAEALMISKKYEKAVRILEKMITYVSRGSQLSQKVMKMLIICRVELMTDPRMSINEAQDTLDLIDEYEDMFLNPSSDDNELSDKNRISELKQMNKIKERIVQFISKHYITIGQMYFDNGMYITAICHAYTAFRKGIDALTREKAKAIIADSMRKLGISAESRLIS